MAGFLNQHVNLVILLADSAAGRLEHAAVPALATAITPSTWCSSHIPRDFASCSSGLITMPIIYFAELTHRIARLLRYYLGLWLIYFSVAAVQFYRGQIFWTAARALVGGVLAQLIAIDIRNLSCVWVYAQFAYS